MSFGIPKRSDWLAYRTLAGAALTFLIPIVVLAQEAGVVVKGRVVDAQTGKALVGAGVSLRGGGESAEFAQSDAQGRFQMEVDKPGRYSAMAMVSPYEPGGDYIEIRPGQKEAEVTLSLDRGSVLAGRVTDHLDQPIVGARVSAYSKEIVQQGPGSIETAWTRYDSHSSFSTSAYKGVTDDRGEYRIWGLRPSEYVLFAKPPPDPAAPGVVRLRAAPTFYPNVEKFEEAGRIRLGWADVREGLDIRVGPPSPTRQTVRIAGAAPGCRSCGVNIYRRGTDLDLLVAFAGPSPNGELILEGFAPGEYQIGARQSEGIGPGTSGQLDFLITPDGDRPVQVALGPMVVVRGRVILEEAPDPLPEPPFKNPTFPQFNVVRIYNLPGEREKISFSCRGEATLFVGEGAERTFEALAFPGRCRLDARGPMTSYIAGMTLDGQPLEKSEIVIPPGGLTSEVVVRVRFDMGEVAGRLEKPGETDWIFFLPTGEDKSGGYLPGKVQPDGTFRAKLPPGAWEALALRGSSRPVLNGQQIEDLASRFGRLPRVQVKAGQTTAMTEPLSVIE